MRKILVLMLALIMIMGVFTACSGNGDGDSDEGGSGAGEGVETELTVGFIYVGPRTDGGFSEAQDRGREAMEEYFGGRVKTRFVESVDENVQDVRAAAMNLMDQGASVIVATSFGFMEAINELAGEYPDVKFMHFSGNMMNPDNFGNYFGAMEEPRYLTGMIAGMMTETNKLGYVAAFDYTELQIGINAFTLGALSVNPDVEVSVVYTNNWHDPALEKAAAEGLLEAGCDILAQHVDTAGPQVAAEAANGYAIGYNMDSRDAAPGAYLTAPIWNHSAYYIDQIEKIMNGTWKPESYYGTMADNYVLLGDMTDNVPQDVQEKVKEVEAAIIAGEFNVFSAEDEAVLYNDGSVMIESGQTLTREELWGLEGHDPMVKLVNGAQGGSN